MRLLCLLAVLAAAAESQPWEQKEFDCDRPAHGCDDTKCCEYGLAVYTREKAARIADFPRELEWRITHLVVAHHGRREYGSPKEPVTLEAMVVHALDDLDTRVSSFGQLFAAAPPGARWTDSRNIYGRQLLIPERGK